MPRKAGAFERDLQMKHCPRCHLPKLEDDENLNALSHRDNKTFICFECGDDESFIDAGLQVPDENELAFVRMLRARGVVI